MHKHTVILLADIPHWEAASGTMQLNTNSCTRVFFPKERFVAIASIPVLCHGNDGTNMIRLVQMLLFGCVM